MPRKQEDSVFKGLDLSKLQRKGELTSKLNELHRALRDLSQDPSERPRELKQVAAQLISTKILENSDKDIRLLCACCTLDLFRVFAPDAPFQDSETVRIFEMISSLIYGLSTLDVTSAAGSGSKLNYILNSLAVIKSCVVPVILAQNGVKGADEVVMSMIHALVSSIRSENSEEVLSLVGDILVACIDESDENIDQRLMDIIFKPLIPVDKLENPTAFKVLSVVIRKVAPKLQKPVTSFLNHVLVGTVGTTQVDDSELADHVYPLIYELHRINSKLLDRVLPNICTQLKTEDEDIRKNAVRLLGKLFASPSAEYAKEFERNFKEFLERFNDLSLSIRLDMVESGIEIMRAKSEVRRKVEEQLTKKLRDPESDVRLKVLTVLLEFGYEAPLELSSSTYKEMSQRVNDKDTKKDFRQIVLVGFARIYRKYVSINMPLVEDLVSRYPGRIAGGVGDPLMEQCFGVEISSRFNFVPGMIVKCFGYPDMATRHTAMHMFQEYILPKSASSVSHASSNDEANIMSLDTDLASSGVSAANVDSKRAAALLVAYDSFDEIEKSNFTILMEMKRKIRNELQKYLDAIFAVKKSSQSSQSSLFQDRHNNHNNSSSSAGGGSYDGDEATIRRSRLRLYGFFSSDKKATGLLEKLEQMKDKTIFKLLRKSIDSNTLTSDCLSSRDDLLQRLGSKTPLSELVGQIFDVSAYLVANADVSKSLCKAAVEMTRPPTTANRSKASASSRSKDSNNSMDTDNNSDGSSHSGIMSELLTKLMKYFPYSFQSSTRHFSELITIGNETETSGRRLSSFPLSKVIEVIDQFSSIACDAIKLNSNILLSNQSFNSQASQSNGSSSSDSTSDFNGVDDFFSNLLTSAFEEVASPDDCFHICTAVNRHFTMRPSSTFPNLSRIVLEIVSEDRLSLENPRLTNDLAILCAVSSVPLPNSTSNPPPNSNSISSHASLLIHSFSGDYSSLRNNLLEFVKDNLCNKRFWDKGGVNFKSVSDVGTVKSISWGVSAWSAVVASEVDFVSNKKAAFTLSADEISLKTTNTSRRKNGSSSSSSVALSAASNSELMFNTWIRANFNETKTSLNDLHACLFKGVELKGGTFGNVDIENASCRDVVFETCASLLFRHVATTELSNNFKTLQWRILAWSLLSPNFEIRKRLVEIYCTIIQSISVPLRFLAYSCLLGSDESPEIKKKVESCLSFAITRARSTYNDVCKKMAMLDPSDAQVVSLQKYITEKAPEVTLAFSLYLLSYHPDLPTSANLSQDSDQKRVQNVAYNIKLILKALLTTIEVGGENVSYLLKQTNLIAHKYVDKGDPENIGLQFVARIAVKLLNEKIDTPENVQNYPGDIYMPSNLYAEKKSKNSRNRGGKSSNATDDSMQTGEGGEEEEEEEEELMYPSSQLGGLDEADQAIDKVLMKIKGTGGRQGGFHAFAGPRKNVFAGAGAGPRSAAAVGGGSGGGGDGDDDEEDVKKGSPKLKKAQEKSSKSPKKPTKVVPLVEPSRRSNRAVKTANYTEVDESDEENGEEENGNRMKNAGKSIPTAATTSTSKMSMSPARSSLDKKGSSLQRLLSPAKPAITASSSVALNRSSIGSTSSVSVSNKSSAAKQQSSNSTSKSKKLADTDDDESPDGSGSDENGDSDSSPLRRPSRGASSSSKEKVKGKGKEKAKEKEKIIESKTNPNSNSKSKSSSSTAKAANGAAGAKRPLSSVESSSQDEKKQKQPKINQFMASKKAK